MHMIRVWNLVVLKITGFDDYFYKNNRFFQFLIFKITWFANYLPFITLPSTNKEAIWVTVQGSKRCIKVYYAIDHRSWLPKPLFDAKKMDTRSNYRLIGLN